MGIPGRDLLSASVKVGSLEGALGPGLNQKGKVGRTLPLHTFLLSALSCGCRWLPRVSATLVSLQGGL